MEFSCGELHGWKKRIYLRGIVNWGSGNIFFHFVKNHLRQVYFEGKRRIFTHNRAREGRRENRKLGKAEGRATESRPQRGVASGTAQVIERPKVGPKSERRGIERVKSNELSRMRMAKAKGINY
jgi:hypothetical protein